jgi:hypothetical protein
MLVQRPAAARALTRPPLNSAHTWLSLCSSTAGALRLGPCLRYQCAVAARCSYPYPILAARQTVRLRRRFWTYGGRSPLPSTTRSYLRPGVRGPLLPRPMPRRGGAAARSWAPALALAAPRLGAQPAGRPGRAGQQGADARNALRVCTLRSASTRAESVPEAPACTAAAEAKEGQDARQQLFGAFTVIGSLRTSGPQRLDFRFAEAMLKLGARSLWLPPFGRGWFDVVYMDTRLRVTRDSRGDTSVLLRVGDLQIEDGDVLLGGLY